MTSYPQNNLNPDGSRRPQKRQSTSDECPLLDYSNTPKETKKAAYIASKTTLRRNCDLALAFIRERGGYGATMIEVTNATGVLYASMSSVVKRLKKDGLIRHNGETRKTPSGCKAAVIVVVEVHHG